MVGKIIAVFADSVIILIVAFMAIMYVPRIFGVSPYVVLSGSMEPTYHVGSLIFVNENFETIEVGETITYHMNANTLVTHRVVEIDPDRMLYTTKGDANNTVDIAQVAYNNIVGKPMFTIPFLGYAAVFATSLNGRIALVSLIALMILISYLPRAVHTKKDISSS